MGSFKFVGLLLVVLLSCGGAQISKAETRKRAAYFMTNDPYGSSIVASTIAADGKLTSPVVLTPTGGKGGISYLRAGGPSFPDALFTQDSVVVSENYLFAVNPGSNTLSLFYIDKEDPLHPTLIGKPADTLGEFPTSVAYSSKLKTACVLHDGAVAGVTCFSVDKKVGLKALDKSPRPMPVVQQQTPPTGVPGTASDVIFNPSSTALIAMVKSPDPMTQGFFYAWPVKNGRVSRKSVFSSFPGLQLPFSGTFLGSDSRMLVSDPTFGFGVVDISQSLEMSLEVATNISGQQAVCWTIYEPKVDSMYILDTAVTNLTVADPKTGAIKTQILFDEEAVGAYDCAINRKWMYFLAGDASLIVLDLINNCEFQKFDLSWLGNRATWEGMAIFPSSRE